MSDAEKKDLFEGMNSRREKNKAVLETVNGDDIVHVETGWTVKDLVGHLVYWDVITLTCVQNRLKGSDESVDMSIGVEAFNNIGYEKYKDHSMEEIVTHWHDTREIFKNVIENMTDEQWSTAYIPPWGGDRLGTVAQFAKGMQQHEGHHIKEIIAMRDGTTEE